MLKITKGLKEFTSQKQNIMAYTDDKGNKYVRVKIEDEDFCIAAHDFVRDGKARIRLSVLKFLIKEGTLSIFTRKQAALCAAFQDDINTKLKEIGGDAFKPFYYWTSTDCFFDGKWAYHGEGAITRVERSKGWMVRPVINM